jgi:hypothetical protein
MESLLGNSTLGSPMTLELKRPPSPLVEPWLSDYDEDDDEGIYYDDDEDDDYEDYEDDDYLEEDEGDVEDDDDYDEDDEDL